MLLPFGGDIRLYSSCFCFVVAFSFVVVAVVTAVVNVAFISGWRRR